MIKSIKWLLFFKGFYKKTYKIESDDVQLRQYSLENVLFSTFLLKKEKN